jgi:hypothetical protein
MGAVEIAALITSAATLVASVTAAVVSFTNRRHIQEIHLSINSRMDELLRVSGEAQHALGVKQEAEREK